MVLTVEGSDSNRLDPVLGSPHALTVLRTTSLGQDATLITSIVSLLLSSFNSNAKLCCIKFVII
jgi:hypothetical protein